MKLVKRILLALLIAVLAVVTGIALSIPVDRALTRSRVEQLSNLTLPTTNIRAYLTAPTGFDLNTFSATSTDQGSSSALAVIIMIHEFWGLRPELLGKADALAEEGYLVIAPDTFRGKATSWLPTAIWQTLHTPTERVHEDLSAVYDWLVAQPGVDATRIMVMGFCFGGGKALSYSLVNPDITATAVFYGSPITDADELAALPGAVLGIFGREDASIPISEVTAFEAALAMAGVPHTVTLYDDVGHAFVKDIEDIRAGGQDAAAWQQFLEFAAAELAGI